MIHVPVITIFFQLQLMEVGQTFRAALSQKGLEMTFIRVEASRWRGGKDHRVMWAPFSLQYIIYGGVSQSVCPNYVKSLKRDSSREEQDTDSAGPGPGMGA